MESKESLNKIKDWVEYITRLDYVEPIVRGEVKEALYNAYHKTTPEFEIIEQDLEILEIIKQKAKGNRFFKGCLLRMFQEDGEKKTYLDKSPRKIEKNYYKIKEWLENDKQ